MSEQFWLHLGPPVLSLQSHSHWGQPFISGLSQKPFRHRKKKMERGGSRERDCSGKERGSASAAPSARIESRLWISMPLMTIAVVERKYSSNCLCVSRKLEQVVQLLVLFCFVCPLCNTSATLFRPLLLSGFSAYNKHNHWGMMLLWESCVLQFQYSRMYSKGLWCLTELAVVVLCSVLSWAD